MATPDPPPMTPEGYERASHDVHAHEHAVCVYDSHDDLEAPLGRFIEQGVAQEQLTVFVHSFASEAEAWAYLERAHPGAGDLRNDQLVVVSLYRDAFEGDGRRIDHEHVARVVEDLVKMAEEHRRAGTRIFIDASRVYFADRRADEWFEFESWLGRRLHHEVGLVCAYQRSDATRPDLFPEMLRTHAYRFDAPTRST